MPNSMNTSPIRVVMKALIAASRADFLPYQKPINRYEHSPMISQAINKRTRLLATTSANIPAANKEI